MKVVIIEDELLAQAKMEHMLRNVRDSIEVVAKISSVKDALTWLDANAAPDLAFVDIQLSDDHCFEIFRQRNITFPVVFTTAFDKYLLESFEYNSIDYLLKPITEEKLSRSLEKVERLEKHFVSGKIQNFIQTDRIQSSQRIIGKRGTEFQALPVEDIAYFYTEHKIVFVRNHAGSQFIVDKNLTELEEQLDQKNFFRLNRKFIASMRAIEKFKSDSGKVRIFLQPGFNEAVFVSKESAPSFRHWIQTS